MGFLLMSKTDLIKQEEKRAHALISRGLLTLEEFEQFRKSLNVPPGDLTVEEMLTRLAEAGLITKNQAQRLQSEMEALTRHHIPGYHLLEKLGKGSMGTVYKARQLSMNRLVAVKILKSKLAANEEFLERFHREAHLAAKFSSNNVVQAIDVGSSGNINYFVMEYVEGTTLKQELESGKIFDEREAIEIVLQIAQALTHAHRRQLIHRDIKPANIILTPDRVAKLADLGMARGTADLALAKAEKGMTIGTPHYIAPEQINSRGDVDSRADIYSLGATLYHMVTGQHPFPHKKTAMVLRAHLFEDLTPPDHINRTLSAGLGEVVESMMAKKREDRYPSPAELVMDLEFLLAGESPKMARQRRQSASLEDLAKGETVDEEEDGRPPKKRRRKKDNVPALWLYVAGVILIFSLIGNLFLLLR
jgi:serine/threonine protein kinase